MGRKLSKEWLNTLSTRGIAPKRMDVIPSARAFLNTDKLFKGTALEIIKDKH
jgi:hypothetical protein